MISACVPSKPVHEVKVLPADRLIKKIEAKNELFETTLKAFYEIESYNTLNN